MKIVVVLGMHRSGTSVVTRGLQALNVSLGSNLMSPADGENEKGFWEDMDVHNLNEKLLNKLGASWDSIKSINKTDLFHADLDEERLLATKFLEEKVKNIDIFGFKDPRCSILLPFWQSIFEKLKLEVNYVIVLRNPLSVSKSLFERNEFSSEKALFLWEMYQISAIDYTNHGKRLIVEFDEILDNTKYQLERMATFLDISGPGENQTLFESYADEFVSNELRHNNCQVSDLNDSVPLVVTKTYMLLHEIAMDKIEFSDEKFTKQWSDIVTMYHSFSYFYPYIDRVELECQLLKQELIHEKELTEQKINIFLNSKSWRLTKPLRYVYRTLLGIKN